MLTVDCCLWNFDSTSTTAAALIGLLVRRQVELRILLCILLGVALLEVPWRGRKSHRPGPALERTVLFLVLLVEFRRCR